MPEDLLSLSSLAGLLFFLGFLPYIWGILRKGKGPAKASWIIWAALDLVLAVGMLRKQALNGQIVGAFIGATTVAILSFKYGESGWKRIDAICFLGLLIGLGCWWALSSPILGIVICAILEVVGMIPTITRAWQNPSSEDASSWVIWWVSCVVALAAIQTWNLSTAAQPLSFTINESAMMIAIIRAALRRKKN